MGIMWKSWTRDNLAKQREVLDQSCVFRAEKESVDHLFFQCCVAKRIWHIVLTMLNLSDDCNYETVASRWLANKHHNVNNIICAKVLWCLWKLRNNLFFQGTRWRSEKQVFFLNEARSRCCCG